uniref:Uncharacterized protein n=1 Tax=Leishmania guyanensis TaxID=5670 RepID=A0A1E1J2P9_LEIGU|nr:Hypothetical protein BN36_2845680 [Leishmania guyanensis]
MRRSITLSLSAEGICASSLLSPCKQRRGAEQNYSYLAEEVHAFAAMTVVVVPAIAHTHRRLLFAFPHLHESGLSISLFASPLLLRTGCRVSRQSPLSTGTSTSVCLDRRVFRSVFFSYSLFAAAAHPLPLHPTSTSSSPCTRNLVSLSPLASPNHLLTDHRVFLVCGDTHLSRLFFRILCSVLSLPAYSTPVYYSPRYPLCGTPVAARVRVLFRLVCGCAPLPPPRVPDAHTATHRPTTRGRVAYS